MENHNEKQGDLLSTQPLGKLIMKFAIPSIISMLVNSLYNIVDQIFIGQGVGYLGNAATNIAFPLVTVSLAVALLVGNGGAAHLSLRLGAKEYEKAEKGVGNCIALLVVFSILFFAGGMGFRIPLLNVFGATPSTMQYALDYATIIIWGLPFSMMAIGLNALIRADNSPRIAMVSMVSGALINVVLDPIFIFAFQWGVKGAAWATILGQFVSFAISLAYVTRFKCVKLKKHSFRPDWHVTGAVLNLGMSSFITQISIAIVMVVMNNSVRHYGALSQFGSDIPLSVLGIVMKVNQILISIIVGLAIGAQPIIGYNFGAKNYDRVKKAFRIVITVTVICTAIGFLFFMFFPQTIVNLFGQEEGLYNEFAVLCFRVGLMLCIPAGLQTAIGIFFQAIGKPLKSALISVSRQIVIFIPMALILPLFWGIYGCLYAMPVSDALAFLLALGLIVYEMGQMNRLEKEQMGA